MSDADPARDCPAHRQVEVAVLVTIEDAPAFVESLATPASSLTLIALAPLDGTVDQLERSTVKLVDHYVDSLSVLPVPMVDVVRFSCLALGEDAYLPQSGTRPSGLAVAWTLS